MYPIYCINLTSRTDRWAHMQAEASAAGLSLIRVEAIDAATLDQTPPGVGEPGSITGAAILPGDLACSLSHRKAWSMMLEAGHPGAVFLEDDCFFAPDIAEVLPPDWISADVQLIKLETVLRPTRVGQSTPVLGGKRSLARLRARHTGAAAYVLGAQAARMLVAHTGVFKDPVDHILFNPKSALFSQLAPVQLIPAPVIQGNLVADEQSSSWAQSSIDGFRFEVTPELRTRTSHRMLGKKAEPGGGPVPLRRRLRQRLQTALGLQKHPVPFG